MELAVYTEAIKRTIKPTGDPLMDKLHFILGINGEFFSEIWVEDIIHNIDRKETIKEIGDFMWYFMNYCSSKELVPQITGEVYDLLPTLIGQLNEYEKKLIFYERERNISLETHFINGIFTRMFRLMTVHQITLEEVFQTNIDKLIKRFPDQFSNEAAQAKADEETIVV
jgi:NTP pyrophosphatase (non-canonical NTP hydrolase)